MNIREIRKIRPTSIIVLILLVGAAVISYVLYQDQIGANGRLYSSKLEMCEQFAKSYLRTTRKVQNINDFSGDDWQRAIAVESEINNLCQLELTDESLENYSPTNIKMYLNEYRYK